MLFVNVMVFAALVVPTVTVPKFSLAGEIESSGRPVPERAKTCGVFTALSAIVSAPDIDPVIEGVKLTETVQVLLGSIVCPAQVSVSSKSPLTLTELMLRLKLPEFVKVTVLDALDWPTTVLANFKLEGERPTTGKTDGASPQKSAELGASATNVAAAVAGSKVYRTTVGVFDPA